MMLILEMWAKARSRLILTTGNFILKAMNVRATEEYKIEQTNFYCS